MIECFDESQEKGAILEFLNVIDQLKPSIIGGYNSANFDWYWIFERCKALHIDIKRICKTLNPKNPIKQSENLLKLANEVERYNQVGMWGYNVIDIIHSVRRAQAINSGIKSAGLKYITKYIDAAVGVSTTEEPMMESEVEEVDKLAAKIAKALKDKANQSPEDQNNIKQARKAMNDDKIDVAKKIIKPYLSEKIAQQLKSK